MRVKFTDSENTKRRHFVHFMDSVDDTNRTYIPHINSVQKLIKDMFPSVKFNNENSIMFTFDTDEDEAFFLLWSSNNEIIV